MKDVKELHSAQTFITTTDSLIQCNYLYYMKIWKHTPSASGSFERPADLQFGRLTVRQNRFEFSLQITLLAFLQHLMKVHCIVMLPVYFS